MDADGLVEFERHRPRLFALAYRMLGSAAEAEDAVQETYLRWDATNRAEIRSAEAWLTTVLVNLCRSWLDSARARRETYVGPWLPEPVPTGRGELGPLESAEQRELVSMAFLTLAERLSATERAVFVLREAFGYAHREIADMLGLTESNAQQVYRRAAHRVREERPRFESAPAHARELVEKFLSAAQSGDLAALESMFTADIVAVADGGAKVHAAKRPIVGIAAVLRYLAGLFAKVPDATFAIEEINAAPAFVVHQGQSLVGVMSVTFDGERIAGLQFVVNPDKLAYFARVERALTDETAG
ncbi:RNA polymerase sigma-70 factor [Nocardia sp. CDC153]|uniref:RNA polymerase sigma-70 factor n=1 Tax=Nocardia sp. CDC153 TaxID=3112167 RepID=UPI002DBA3356|nr:RNA polymerase sigma-70 factor [Nocardia sp. CDC153]MEC3958680.1 RNA polymerase sigma-70 factor [Nocardia sp. CDC153]